MGIAEYRDVADREIKSPILPGFFLPIPTDDDWYTIRNAVRDDCNNFTIVQRYREDYNAPLYRTLRVSASYEPFTATMTYAESLVVNSAGMTQENIDRYIEVLWSDEGDGKRSSQYTGLSDWVLDRAYWWTTWLMVGSHLSGMSPLLMADIKDLWGRAALYSLMQSPWTPEEAATLRIAVDEKWPIDGPWLSGHPYALKAAQPDVVHGMVDWAQDSGVTVGVDEMQSILRLSRLDKQIRVVQDSYYSTNAWDGADLLALRTEGLELSSWTLSNFARYQNVYYWHSDGSYSLTSVLADLLRTALMQPDRLYAVDNIFERVLGDKPGGSLIVLAARIHRSFPTPEWMTGRSVNAVYSYHDRTTWIGLRLLVHGLLWAFESPDTLGVPNMVRLLVKGSAYGDAPREEYRWDALNVLVGCPDWLRKGFEVAYARHYTPFVARYGDNDDIKLMVPGVITDGLRQDTEAGNSASALCSVLNSPKMMDMLLNIVPNLEGFDPTDTESLSKIIWISQGGFQVWTQSTFYRIVRDDVTSIEQLMHMVKWWEQIDTIGNGKVRLNHIEEQILDPATPFEWSITWLRRQFDGTED